MKKSIILLAAIFAFTIVKAQEKTSMNVDDLSKTITKQIEKSYVGYKTLEAYKIDTKGVTSYEVIVEKAPNKLDLYYDADGKFLKKEMEKKDPSAKATPAKAATAKTSTDKAAPAKTATPKKAPAAKTSTSKPKTDPKAKTDVKADTTKQPR